VKKREFVRAWIRILLGFTPSLSIEITRECPLSCPGCYAYGDNHLGGQLLRQVRDHKGQDLVDGVLRLVKIHRPIHVSLVGGEPLVRFRELSILLPLLAKQGIHTQIVTSAVSPIPKEWRDIPRLSVVVSIDGLQPEHDAHRKPATYDRILKHIEGQPITVHCTITRQMTEREGYLREFVRLWSSKSQVVRIWMSLFSPQIGEKSDMILPPMIRQAVIDELSVLQGEFVKLELPKALLDAYRKPPKSPDQCTFARITRSITADLQTRILPCQFGGTPDCSQCGCAASAGLDAVARHVLPLGIRVGAIFEASSRVGRFVDLSRRACAHRSPYTAPVVTGDARNPPPRRARHILGSFM